MCPLASAKPNNIELLVWVNYLTTAENTSVMETAACNSDWKPALERLEWVAPSILVMDAYQTEGKTHTHPFEFFVNGTQGHGPS